MDTRDLDHTYAGLCSLVYDGVDMDQIGSSTLSTFDNAIHQIANNLQKFGRTDRVLSVVVKATHSMDVPNFPILVKYKRRTSSFGLV